METVEDREINKLLHQPEKINTIIIGASAAGLACAATLTKQRIPYLILEKNSYLAGPWRAHYDRLHLNTEKWNSHLPYLPFPQTAGTYVPKDEVVKYLENYATTFGIEPIYNQQVQSVSRLAKGWLVSTVEKTWVADHVIIATGHNRQPVMPRWPGMELFKGVVMHSSAYKNGAAFCGKNVLVVGFGSSACEIAMCLHEYGAFPSMSVKGAVNVVPRDAGNQVISRILYCFTFLSHLFPSLIDRVNARRLNKRYGFLREFGLRKLPYGPNVQTIKYKKVPVLDIGTMALIKEGIIKIYPAIERFLPSGISFKNGEEKKFDVVILATGYEPHVSDFLKDAEAVTDQLGRPLKSGEESALQGLFFCGFTPSPYGMLNKIGKEARKIAALISSKRH